MEVGTLRTRRFQNTAGNRFDDQPDLCSGREDTAMLHRRGVPVVKCSSVAEIVSPREDRSKVSWFEIRGSALQIQPAFERSSHLAYHASIQLSRGIANEFGEFHGLDTLNVDVALLP
ncbi:MAG: hypothetical protein JWM99_1511 [Verrucomicrobiales bacterium]|nr:hypothetical protein [Verrucomicrobiales bacterium]